MFGLVMKHWQKVHPALYSHCTRKETSVREVMDSGLQTLLVPRLTPLATQQLNTLQASLSDIILSDEQDHRLSPFSNGDVKLDSGMVYRLLKARSQGTNEGSAFIWKNSAPPRVQMFMWLLTQGRIQCRTNLQRKNIVPTALCEVCEQADETPEHIINGCPIAMQFWAKIGVTMAPDFTVTELYKINRPSNVPQQEFGAFIALSCWQLWKTRNALVFRNERTSTQQLLLACMREAEQWRARLPRRKKCVADQWCAIFRDALGR
jgi:hypothetical protein